jgi:hypothetical protein
MKKLPIIACAVLLLGGCATWQGESDGLFSRDSGATRIGQAEAAGIAQAKQMLAKGDATGAAKVLRAMCTGKGVPGVTDEALFRLALLTLRPRTEMSDSKEGRQLLQRLKKEYPHSPWTVQASPLIDFIAATDGIRQAADRARQQSRNFKAANRSLGKENQSCARDQRMLSEKNRSLAERNQTLANENRSLSEENIELNNIIEQLKHLDLELDQKTR